ncbi:MAG TPA: class I SAM-dependent rRNA methyltransferase [Acidimicrobiales bacterium]|nr:class I SAM-dependent rRNA methyltransferase [Acidimicrobiales bacterium]
MAETTLVLRAGKERSLARRHPWIFSGAVERVRGHCDPGDVLVVRDSTGRMLGRAGYNPASQIVGRMWTFDDAAVDDALVAKRIEAAVARRQSLDAVTNAARLVYSESDGIPGLIVDRYDDVAVLQFTAATAERWRRVIVEVCGSLHGINSVFERSDLDVRRLEGLSPASGLLAGAEPPPYVEISENGCRYLVDVRRGHKTGFYLDQRDNRRLVAQHASARRVLNLFCYTGAFSVAAMRGGASNVVSVDSSAQALEIGRNNAELNDVTDMQWVKADVFAYLRELRDAGATFDLIVLDPPKLAASAAQVRRAARGYKDLNWLAFRLLAPGGHLATFSCSGAVDSELFTKVVAGAALDARREVSVVGHLGQASDHPVPLSFPESAYLKGLWCRAD